MRVHVICYDEGDVTSFYRGLAPMGALQKLRPEVQVQSGFGQPLVYNPNTFRLMDTLFMQRPSKDHLQILRSAKRSGIPVWVDYDDDPFNVGPEHPHYSIFSEESFRNGIRECLETADVVTVTTEALGEEFRKYNRDVRVIPNAFDDLMFQKRHRLRTRSKKIVLWRGSRSHQKDLLDIVGNLDEEHKLFPDWGYFFMGMNPWFITERLPEGKRETTGWLPGMIPYMDSMEIVSPDIVIVPLVDNGFNRCKSNIAWIEASFFGAAVIAPDWPEWRKPGVINYRDRVDFHAKLQEAMGARPEDLRALAAESWGYILANLKLTDVNVKRYALLRGLV